MMLRFVLPWTGILAVHDIHPALMLGLENNVIGEILSKGTAVSSNCNPNKCWHNKYYITTYISFEIKNRITPYIRLLYQLRYQD